MTDVARETSPPIRFTHLVEKMWEDAAMIDPAYSSADPWGALPPKGTAEWYAALIGYLEGGADRQLTSNYASIRERLAQGLSRQAFDRLRRMTDIGTEQLAAAIAVPMRTLARRKVLKADESERLLRVAAAFQHTLEALEDLDAARRWFVTPKRALGGKTPFEFSDTGPGAEEVARLLGRIEHGVYT